MSVERGAMARWMRLAGFLPGAEGASEGEVDPGFLRILSAFEGLERAEATSSYLSFAGVDPADPPAFGAPDTVRLRPDVPGVSLPRREALAAAPDARRGCFAVPRVVRK